MKPNNGLANDERGWQDGEAVVLCGLRPHKLRHSQLVPGSVRMRGRPRLPAAAAEFDANGPETSEDDAAVRYEENADFRVDYANGCISRTENGRLPDWREHPFYGRERFDHRGMTFEQYANTRYTVYVDYSFAKSGDASAHRAEGGPEIAAAADAVSALKRVKRKLAAGGPVVYTVFGDSISVGHDASREAYSYAGRFVRFLRQAYPQARIEMRMKARGGETSGGALARLEEDVVRGAPDLVTIGYGMNDQNRRETGGNSVSPEQFAGNMRRMLERLAAETDADVLLLTPCLPNPKWIFSSDNAQLYAEALRRLSAEFGCGLADVQRIWQEEQRAGKTPESLLMNNLNHPNDYGHRLYFEGLRRAWDGGHAENRQQ